MSPTNWRAMAICALLFGCLRGEVPTASQEITFDLIARDKKGKPVQNLEPRDLRVWDNGQAVTLTKLEFVPDQTDTRRTVTFVIDHMEATGIANAKKLAERMLKITPNSGIDFAVFKIDGRLKLYQQATSNRELVRRAIEGLDRNKGESAEAERTVEAAAKADVDAAGRRLSAEERQEAKALVAALQESQRMGRDFHVQSSLGALLALARAEQSQTGRKAILFFSGGVRADLNTQELMRSLIGTANSAGISIYAIDANSLDSKEAEAMNAGMALQRSGMQQQNSVAPAAPTGPVVPENTSVGPGAATSSAENMGRIENGADPQQNVLVDLCTSTAGRFLGNGENLKYELRRMLMDLTSYYRASYDVPSMQYDGRFRRVQVKPVARNIRILARSGYLALPPASPVGTRPFEAALQKVLAQPQLPTDVGFRCALMQMGQEKTTNALVVEVPFRDFQAAEDVNTKLYSLHMSMVAQVKDKSGTVIESFSEDLPRRGAQEAKDRMRNEIVTMTRHFDAPPGDYILEVAIQDGNSGKVGAQRRPISLTKSPAGLYLSDVALVRRTEALHSDADREEPWQYQENRIVPDISDVVAREAKEISFFFVLQTDEQTATKPKLELEIRRDGQAVGRRELPLRQSGGGKPMAYVASLKTSGFGAAQYEAAAILSQDGKTVERVKRFGVDGPQIASAGEPTMLMPKAHTAFTIAPAKGTVTAPADEALSALLSAATQHATDYTNSLPNVMCTEVTNRSVDPLGTGGFQHKDTITELLRYHDKIEQRLTMGVDNKTTDWDRSALKGTITSGEFGGLLNSIFAADARARFAWKETDELGADPVQVFGYQVAAENSTLVVKADNGQFVKPGFHGSVYVDESTQAIRRLTLESDQMAEDFPTHAVKFTVDYDYIAIGEHEYLLPVTGSARIIKGKRMVVLNEFEFRDYKRYSAESNVRFDR